MSKTRYTSLGFWAAGLALFQLAHSLVFYSSYNPTFLLASMRHAQQPLSSPNQGYLLKRHFKVDLEPPQPQ
ncbi:hypothetical protein EV1_027512 [Malus domestica]